MIQSNESNLEARAANLNELIVLSGFGFPNSSALQFGNKVEAHVIEKLGDDGTVNGSDDGYSFTRQVGGTGAASERCAFPSGVSDRLWRFIVSREGSTTTRMSESVGAKSGRAFVRVY
jgi:hypothetical protein